MPADPSSSAAPRLPPLRLVRHAHTTFDARFFERHEAFWPIARAARVFADRAEWPDVREYARAFVGAAPVTFEPARPRPRRRATPTSLRSNLYDAKIVTEAVVPTRPRSWHDYLNALVWASFPRAKKALHARQHRAVQAWIPAGATRLPNARTRELDALALLDEGGILTLEGAGQRVTLVFGHALYEGIVLDHRAMVARGASIVVAGLPSNDDARVALADEALTAVIEDPTRLDGPDELTRARIAADSDE